VRNQEIAKSNLRAFKNALSKNLISLEKGEVHDDIVFHADKPNGEDRITYGLMGNNSILKAACVVVLSEPYKGKPCFDTGISTVTRFQRQGHGKLVLEKSIDELKNGLARSKIEEFYIELKVDNDNEPSRRLCSRFTDETISKENVTIYMLLVQ